MKEWPASLPRRSQRDGYQSGFGEGRINTPTEAGPGKSRRRFSYVPRPMNARYVMTREQLATFKTFVDDELGGGVLPFRIPNHEGSGTSIVRIGTNMPQWVPLGGPQGFWSVTMELLVL